MSRPTSELEREVGEQPSTVQRAQLELIAAEAEALVAAAEAAELEASR